MHEIICVRRSISDSELAFRSLELFSVSTDKFHPKPCTTEQISSIRLGTKLELGTPLQARLSNQLKIGKCRWIRRILTYKCD
uniref:Uncharacterized protein n=1 Tax=Anopheles minimus TaxID=112268 RepID=A0A182WPA3_9DIPT